MTFVSGGLTLLKYVIILNSVLYEGHLNKSLKSFENRMRLYGPAGGQLTGIVRCVARKVDVGNACSSTLIIITPGKMTLGK